MIWTMLNRIDNSHANGVNVFSEEWDAIARKLNRFGPDLLNKGAGDYATFDGSHKPHPMWGLLVYVVQAWYDDDFFLERQTLWCDMTYSRHILNGFVYEWLSSLPSGHPFTIFINNLMNDFYFRLAWIRVNDDVRSIVKYDESVETQFMGDDNIFATSTMYVDIFTEKAISIALQPYGIKYTSADKGEASSELKHIRDIDFLKRKFRYCDIERRYVAPISMDVITELPLWTKKSHDADYIAFTNTCSALEELALHGEKEFLKLAPKIVKALYKAYGKYPECQDFYSNYVKALHKVDFF
jgi:hypothetical protein